MAAQRMEAIRDMDNGQLLESIDGKRHEIFNLRLQWVTGSLDDPTQIRRARRELARLLTVKRERELAAEMIGGESNA